MLLHVVRWHEVRGSTVWSIKRINYKMKDEVKDGCEKLIIKIITHVLINRDQ